MTLDEAVKEFEAHFTKVIDGEKTATAPNGKPFVVVAVGQVLGEGNRHFLAPSEDAAVRSWLKEAKDLAGFNKVLYWRVRPEIDSHFMRECKQDGSVTSIPQDLKSAFVKEYFLVYSRMAFGDHMDAYRLIHTLDEATFNCTACGATYEAMCDGLAKTCIADGKSHPRQQTEFDHIPVHQ